jgi:hypothetical protein
MTIFITESNLYRCVFQSRRPDVEKFQDWVCGEPEEIIAIYLRRWQIKSLFKQLKQNFPLRYFFGESVNAIKTQIWVTLIANLLLSVIRKRIRRKWSFSNLATMIRQTLMYYIDLYMFCENPEKAWLKIINQSNLSPPEPSLFD